MKLELSKTRSHTESTQVCAFCKKPASFVEIVIPPRGVELLLQHTGLTHICKQSGTESGTVVEDSRVVQMLQALASLTDDERELLAELLKKIG